MKKSILTLGTVLTKPQQQQIQGGIGCRGYGWEVKYEDACNCFMYYRYSTTQGVTSMRYSDEEALNKCSSN